MFWGDRFFVRRSGAVPFLANTKLIPPKKTRPEKLRVFVNGMYLRCVNDPRRKLSSQIIDGSDKESYSSAPPSAKPVHRNFKSTIALGFLCAEHLTRIYSDSLAQSQTTANEQQQFIARICDRAPNPYAASAFSSSVVRCFRKNAYLHKRNQ